MADLEALEDDIRSSMNRIRGRLAGLIESCGLPEKQERSLVSTMKSLTYDEEAHLIEVVDKN